LTDSGRRQRLPAEQVVTIKVAFRRVAERFAVETVPRFPLKAILNCPFKPPKNPAIDGKLVNSSLS
jgi:hypothetical protein